MRELTGVTRIRIKRPRPELTGDTRIRLSQVKGLKEWVEDRKKAKPGDIRTWSDGDYVKNPDGSWSPVNKEKTKQLQEKRNIATQIKALPPINISQNKTMDKKGAEEFMRKLGPVTNKKDGRVVTFPVTTAGKIIQHQGVDYSRIVEGLQPLFETSIKADSRKEEARPNHKSHPNVELYHDYVNKLKLDGEKYYIRFTVREMKNGKKASPKAPKRNEVHSLAVSNIKLYKIKKNGPSNLTGQNPGKAGNRSFYDNRLASIFDIVKSETTEDQAINLL